MLHPALAQALATARVEDQLRAAARWRTIDRARRVARESREAAVSTAGQRSTSTPPTCTPRDQPQGMRRTGDPQAAG